MSVVGIRNCCVKTKASYLIICQEEEANEEAEDVVKNLR